MGITSGLYLIFLFLFNFHVVGIGPLHPPGWQDGLVGSGLLEHECWHGGLGVVEVDEVSTRVGLRVLSSRDGVSEMGSSDTS